MVEPFNMHIVRLGRHSFKVRPADLEAYLNRHPDAVVVGEKVAETEPDPVVESGLVTSASVEVSDSHSDQEIDQVNAILDRIPELTVAQARSIIAGGYTLATLPRDYDALMEIKGIADKGAQTIVEALSE